MGSPLSCYPVNILVSLLKLDAQFSKVAEGDSQLSEDMNLDLIGPDLTL